MALLVASALAGQSLQAQNMPAGTLFELAPEDSNTVWAHDVAQPYDTPADLPTPIQMSGGVAAGDVDNDGDIDLYLVTGSAYPNRLLINDGSGRFTDAAAEWGVARPGEENTAPLLADINGNGFLDLVLGGVLGAGLNIFHNTGEGRFELDPLQGGISLDDDEQSDSSIAAGDPDGDGDLDLYLGHWGSTGQINHFWINTGQGQFIKGDELAGVSEIYAGLDWSFAPSFIDINGDRRQDLLITSDFGTSHTLINLNGIRFDNRNIAVIDDKSGMGSAPGDFDNDGDVDWFVSSIFYENPVPNHGNRLYKNNGTGTFTDATDEAGVRDGAWGWSACAADFDNNGWLDIFHVNGMWFINEREDFSGNSSKLFMNQGEGVFSEQSDGLGIEDSRQGRGVVCFDADLDGDLDIFTANVFGESRLYLNTLGDEPAEPPPAWIQVKLIGEENNRSALGAVIRVIAGDLTQHREVTIGSSYQSQNPLMQHFGLEGADRIDQLEVTWPHGGVTVLRDLPVNQQLVVSASEAEQPPMAIQAGTTAAWFDPARNGEGFLIEVLPNDQAVMYWFTYDREGRQDWYVAAGTIAGRRLLFPELLRVSGGEFGPGFDPEAVTREVVGSAAFNWDDCANGTMDWTLKPGLSAEGFGRQALVRVAPVDGLLCVSPGENPPPPTGTPPPGNGVLTGSFYDPGHAGEGYIVQGLGGTQVLVYWFSFDAQSNRRWFFGVGEAEENDSTLIRFDAMNTTSGGLFGKAFDSSLIEVEPWGTLELDLGCNGGTARWQASEAGFPDGLLNLQRLTRPEGTSCD